MTTAVLRPNGTTSAGSVTGAASAHAATSDDSDSSYFTQTVGSGSHFLLSLGTTTLPAGGITKYLRTRVRASGPSLVNAQIRDAALSTIAGTELANVFGSTATAEGAYVPVLLTQAQIDGLLIYGVADLGPALIYELYVDLVYVTQPVVALDAITDPYTTSSQIACSWTNTLDSDGGGQTAYQLWVTDDNNSNAVVYDSGVVVSSALSANTGPLVNGGEYTVHIKVAQTVNGAYHWSAEDTQADVDLTVTTVDVSSVTAVADNTNAKITVTVTRDVADGAWQYVELERSSDGITWTPVRGSTFVAPTGADTHVTEDYDAANGVSYDYRARATYYSSGVPITSAWVETATTTTWTSDAVWFKVPGSPNLNDTFEFKAYPSGVRSARLGVFPILGASAPIVVSDARSKPVARCTVQTESETESDALLDILAQPVVLIQTPAAFKRWGSRYCAIGDLTDDPLPGGEQLMSLSDVALWSFDAIEVDAPGDPDAGSA